MNLLDMQFSEEMKNNIKEHFGYSEEDFAIFVKNPRNIELLSQQMKLLGKTMVATVVESHGCNSQHKVGS